MKQVSCCVWLDSPESYVFKQLVTVDGKTNIKIKQKYKAHWTGSWYFSLALFKLYFRHHDSAASVLYSDFEQI